MSGLTAWSGEIVSGSPRIAQRVPRTSESAVDSGFVGEVFTYSTLAKSAPTDTRT